MEMTVKPQARGEPPSAPGDTEGGASASSSRGDAERDGKAQQLSLPGGGGRQGYGEVADVIAQRDSQTVAWDKEGYSAAAKAAAAALAVARAKGRDAEHGSAMGQNPQEELRHRKQDWEQRQVYERQQHWQSQQDWQRQERWQQQHPAQPALPQLPHWAPFADHSWGRTNAMHSPDQADDGAGRDGNGAPSAGGDGAPSARGGSAPSAGGGGVPEAGNGCAGGSGGPGDDGRDSGGRSGGGGDARRSTPSSESELADDVKPELVAAAMLAARQQDSVENGGTDLDMDPSPSPPTSLSPSDDSESESTHTGTPPLQSSSCLRLPPGSPPSPPPPSPKRHRKNMAGMTDAERRSWTREQNREHSRLSRERRRQREEALAREVNHLRVFRSLVDGFPDMISLHGDASDDPPVTYANGAFEVQLGVNPAALVGRPLTCVVHPDDMEMLQQAIHSVRQGNADAQISLRLQRWVPT
ncbi:unnamed protein product, partial [Phaeothamnion confervicola]